MDPKQVTPEMYVQFYRFVGNTYDQPRFTLHYKADVPLSVQALLFFPEGKPGVFKSKNYLTKQDLIFHQRYAIICGIEMLSWCF